jgi:hypothetical protein
LAVLAKEPGNYGANYNLATLYYNRGVFNIQRIDADNDIPSIQQIQEASRDFFTLALPYMEKAHDMDPDAEGNADRLGGHPLQPAGRGKEQVLPAHVRGAEARRQPRKRPIGTACASGGPSDDE